jgi:hypothetical protein
MAYFVRPTPRWLLNTVAWVMVTGALATWASTRSGLQPDGVAPTPYISNTTTQSATSGTIVNPDQITLWRAPPTTAEARTREQEEIEAFTRIRGRAPTSRELPSVQERNKREFDAKMAKYYEDQRVEQERRKEWEKWKKANGR